jgi:hypothetical protein
MAGDPPWSALSDAWQSRQQAVYAAMIAAKRNEISAKGGNDDPAHPAAEKQKATDK